MKKIQMAPRLGITVGVRTHVACPFEQQVTTAWSFAWFPCRNAVNSDDGKRFGSANRTVTSCAQMKIRKASKSPVPKPGALAVLTPDQQKMERDAKNEIAYWKTRRARSCLTSMSIQRYRITYSDNQHGDGLTCAQHNGHT